MSDKNIEKSISNPEIIESAFSALVSSLKQNEVPFFIESEGQSKIIRIDLSELKLFYPQTSDLIMFKYSGQAFFRFFFDEETLKQEETQVLTNTFKRTIFPCIQGHPQRRESIQDDSNL